MLKYLLVYINLLFCFSQICYNQGITYIYPVFFNQYKHCLSIINPSASGIEHNYEFNLGHQKVLGDFTKLSTNYFIFNKRLKSYQNTYYPFSSLGFFLYNDREGQYLNRGRIYLQYAWHARLNQKFYFSGGLKLGGVNYLVKGTPLSGNGSDYNVDGGVGVSIYSQNFYFGFCYDQVFNAELQPFDEIAILSPFFILNTRQKIKINESIILTPSILGRILLKKQNENMDFYDFILDCLIKDKISFSGGMKTKTGLIIMTSINNLEFGNGSLSIGISYLIPVRKSELNISKIEFNTRYTFKRIK